MEFRDLLSVVRYAGHWHLDRALKLAGIEILMYASLPGDLYDILAEPYGLMLRGIGREWELWLKAHLLGHRLLHVGNQLEMPPPWVDWQERQAEVFAGYLIFGEPADLYDGAIVTVRGVAMAAHVPMECVRRWWRYTGAHIIDEPRYRRARYAHWSR